MILRFDLRMDGLKLEDGSADDWLKQGQALFEYGDFEGAIVILTLCYWMRRPVNYDNVGKI
jgi:hypothetical protein